MQQDVGTIAQLWRYPVKGMRGEQLDVLHMDANGVVGDRRYAMQSTGAPRGKPLLSGRERAAMLLYTAQVRDGVTEVVTPKGARFSMDDPALLADMQAQFAVGHTLTLLRSPTPLTDVRPVALLGTLSVSALADALQRPVDARRFRANLLLDLSEGFAEDALVGCELRAGSAILRVTERTPRCRMVTLDPLNAEADPFLMKHLDRAHSGRVGVYAAVVQQGEVRVGDTVHVA